MLGRQFLIRNDFVLSACYHYYLNIFSQASQCYSLFMISQDRIVYLLRVSEESFGLYRFFVDYFEKF